MSDGRLSQLPSMSGPEMIDMRSTGRSVALEWFRNSSAGRQALEKLHMMTAGDLERFLLSSDSPLRALLENYLAAGTATNVLKPLRDLTDTRGLRPRAPRAWDPRPPAGSKSPTQRLMRSRSATRGGVLGPLSELLCLPLTRAETPTTPKARRRVLMKRSPAEALMAAAAKGPESPEEKVVVEPEKAKKRGLRHLR